MSRKYSVVMYSFMAFLSFKCCEAKALGLPPWGFSFWPHRFQDLVHVHQDAFAKSPTRQFPFFQFSVKCFSAHGNYFECFRYRDWANPSWRCVHTLPPNKLFVITHKCFIRISLAPYGRGVRGLIHIFQIPLRGDAKNIFQTPLRLNWKMKKGSELGAGVRMQWF